MEIYALKKPWYWTEIICLVVVSPGIFLLAQITQISVRILQELKNGILQE